MCGYLRFGDNTEGMILNNYSNNDLLSNCTRLVMATHIALAYPVIFYPAQIGVVTFIKYTIKYCYSHRYIAYWCHAKLHYRGGGRGGDGDVISEKVDLLLDPDEGGGRTEARTSISLMVTVTRKSRVLHAV